MCDVFYVDLDPVKRSAECAEIHLQVAPSLSSIFTLRAKLSGAEYCYRSCLCRAGGVCLWGCYHDNSKLRASIFTKLGL